MMVSCVLDIQPGQFLSTFQQILMFLGFHGRKRKKGKILFGSLHVWVGDLFGIDLGSLRDRSTGGLGFWAVLAQVGFRILLGSLHG